MTKLGILFNTRYTWFLASKKLILHFFFRSVEIIKLMNLTLSQKYVKEIPKIKSEINLK